MDSLLQAAFFAVALCTFSFFMGWHFGRATERHESQRKISELREQILRLQQKYGVDALAEPPSKNIFFQTGPGRRT